MGEVKCCHCEVKFTIPDEMEKGLRLCHNTFYCPNGHRLYFAQGETELQRTTRILETTQKALTAARDEASRIRQDRDYKDRVWSHRVRYWKGMVTRLKKRGR
jgi:hypothetical protein